ncbi:Phospholipase_B [Hexamita inflata]|uniref:Phospholipase B n=1 Tax=Hexamita inflata TaxID=28002 RepID=A0AA86TZD9_9EUKA|nr:Phospholipase B [Hexamita inflata]
MFLLSVILSAQQSIIGEEKKDITGVVCAIAIPCGVIMLGLIVWALIFYKNGGYMKYQVQQNDTEVSEQAQLIQK